MANPATYPGLQTDNGGVGLSAVFAVGAAGAVGAVSRSRELNATTPITHVSTGLYRINLKESWAAFLGLGGNCEQAAFSTGGACHVRYKTNAVTGATPTIDVEFRKGTDYSLVDPASGDIVTLFWKLQKIKPSATV